jgi:dephospho-CoA kinase
VRGRLLRVGLTGGIASGKSYVLRRLDAAGFATIDLDRVAHGLVARGGAAHAEVVEAFGPGILAGGDVDRKKLGAVVFASPEARARLDAIVHPLVREQEAGMARAAAAAGARVLVTDAALLVEAGMHLRFDRLVVAWCPAEVQQERLRARDGIDEAAAAARLRAQMPGDEKRAFAHFVVDTSGTFAETDAQVDALAAELARLDAALPVAVEPDRARACLERGPAGGPRGLTPASLYQDCLDGGGLDLARLARRLVPPVSGPWYRAAQDDPQPGAETLAAALALCCAARGADGPFVEVAAFSLARLTHGAPAEQAGACLAALAALEVARQASVAALQEPFLEHYAAVAARRAGAPPPARVLEELRRARAGIAAPGTLAGSIHALVA